MRGAVTAIIVQAALAGAAFAQPPLPKVVVGDNPSLSGAPLYIALEKGYYAAAGFVSGMISAMVARPSAAAPASPRKATLLPKVSLA